MTEHPEALVSVSSTLRRIESSALARSSWDRICRTDLTAEPPPTDMTDALSAPARSRDDVEEPAMEATSCSASSPLPKSRQLTKPMRRAISFAAFVRD
jgi:hypothetical protein